MFFINFSTSSTYYFERPLYRAVDFIVLLVKDGRILILGLIRNSFKNLNMTCFDMKFFAEHQECEVDRVARHLVFINARFVIEDTIKRDFLGALKIATI